MSMRVNGRDLDVDGAKIVTWLEDSRLRLNGQRRRTTWPRQWTLHKTIADYPEKIVQSVAQGGRALQTIQNWLGGVDGAALVTDLDGVVYQLVDVATVETFHATASNPWSIGHETEELPDGTTTEIAMRSTVISCLAGCSEVGIQWQMQTRGTYTGHPMPRMAEHGMTPGGPDMVGIFGHRMNTERRGKWDPGEVFWDMLDEAGVHEFDFSKDEDKSFWREIQSDLRQRGLLEFDGEPDGVPGPKTVAALRADGYVDGILARGKAS